MCHHSLNITAYEKDMDRVGDWWYNFTEKHKKGGAEVLLEKPRVSILDIRAFDDREFYDSAYRTVCDERRKKVDSRRFEKDKRLSLAVGYLLEKALEELGVPLGDITYGEWGKPSLKGGGICFSLSHSGNYGVCAVYHKEVGIDIERVREVPPKLVSNICTKAEKRALEGIGAEELKDSFFRIWTAKESYLKYLGVGISQPFLTLETDFGECLTMRCKGELVPLTFETFQQDGHRVTLCF